MGVVAAGVAKADADLIAISGDCGGTGASPLSSIKNAGVPWELGLAEAQQTLRAQRTAIDQVRLQVDGQLKTGRDVVDRGAARRGRVRVRDRAADRRRLRDDAEVSSQHLSRWASRRRTRCLREKFTGRPEHLVNYFFFVAEEVRELMARLGFRSVDEMVGRSRSAARARRRPTRRKARTLDLSALLHAATLLGGARSRRCRSRRTRVVRDQPRRRAAARR